MTKSWAQATMSANPKARPTTCVIRGQCRTRVYEFPKSELVAEDHLRPAVILERAGIRATVVSDLRMHFRAETPLRHYRICCSLQSKIDEALSRRANGTSASRFPLFVVIEQETECETRLDDGTCYIVDQEMVIGGSTGKEALVAWQVDDAPWPVVNGDETSIVNTVLAAVKIVQDETEVIREVAEACCFYDEANRAVYPMSMTMNASLSVVSPAAPKEVADRIARIQQLIETFEASEQDGNERVANLLEALRLEKIDSDHYRRTWYLCLLEAVEEVLSGQDRQEFHQRHRSYRATIGHPKARTTMDMEEFVRLQRDAQGELRRFFLGI